MRKVSIVRGKGESVKEQKVGVLLFDWIDWMKNKEQYMER